MSSLWEEKLIANDLILIKFYLSVDRDTQLFRFKERIVHPLKYWKFSKNDERARAKWEVFTKYKTQMLERTSSEESPWVVINANDKMYARLACMLYTIYHIPYIERQTFKPLLARSCRPNTASRSTACRSATSASASTASSSA